MATNTENLNLKKPAQEDFYNVDDFSENFQKIDEFAGRKDNPHNVTKEQLGLGNVDNTSDADKPVSTAQAKAIADAKSTGTTAQTNITSHTSNKSNPHGVTKAHVGLGSVPNVATNDQTPTYTEASTLTNLTSGEKLSVAFGKIKKAITDLIAHVSRSATSSVMGHVKITDSVTSTATDTAASAKAVKTVYDAAQNTSFKLLKTIDINVSPSNGSIPPVEITGVNWGDYQEIRIEMIGTLTTMASTNHVGVGVGVMDKAAISLPGSQGADIYNIIVCGTTQQQAAGKNFNLDAKLDYQRTKHTKLDVDDSYIYDYAQRFTCKTVDNINMSLIAKNSELYYPLKASPSDRRTIYANYYYATGVANIQATLNIYGR